MNITVNLTDQQHQNVTELAKQYGLTVGEYLQQLIDHDLTASIVLSHETGSSTFHNLDDAITAMYLLDEYFRLDPPGLWDASYETFFLHTPQEYGRIWETVAGGSYYSNGDFGLCDNSAYPYPYPNQTRNWI